MGRNLAIDEKFENSMAYIKLRLKSIVTPTSLDSEPSRTCMASHRRGIYTQNPKLEMRNKKKVQFILFIISKYQEVDKKDWYIILYSW